ncbi:MAG: hypothetical protein EAZ30_02910 [Betaproteobacteria bacterium]|nr:MAG: hypothetical protein EAZ30_02910 [Betaproteobacteria bacterium]
MQFKLFSKSWDGMRIELVIYRYIIAALLLIVVLTLFGWLRKDQSTVLAPPTITEQMEIGRNKASSGYKKSWGLFTATMLGNLTPGNADFVLKSLEDLFAPETYGELRRRLASDLETLKKEQVSVSFEPSLVTYESATDKVFIAGRSIIEGLGGKTDRFQRTYEFCVRQINGKPVVTRFRSYVGEPHVLSYWASKNKQDDDNAQPCTSTSPGKDTASGEATKTSEVKS